MYIVTFVSLIAILFTYLDSKKIFNSGIKWAFFLVTLLGCIHYDYGNDYMSYKNLYEKITFYPFNFLDIINGDVYKEPGWALLCYIFKPLGGFFVMVAFLNILQNYLIYKTLVNHIDRNLWTISMFVYLFAPTLYLMNFSMMRQGLVICIFFGIWNLILERKIIKSLIIVYLCSLIHTSALVLIPFLFMGYIPLHNKKVTRIIVGCLLFVYLCIWLKGSLLNDVLSSVMKIDDFSEYVENYTGDKSKSVQLGLGFLVNQIPLILSLIYLVTMSKRTNINDLYCVLLASLGLILTPFVLLLPSLSRIAMYFTVYQILAISVIYNKTMINKSLLKTLKCVYIILTLLAYYNFFLSPTWTAKYAEFKTIFSIL